MGLSRRKDCLRALVVIVTENGAVGSINASGGAKPEMDQFIGQPNSTWEKVRRIGLTLTNLITDAPSSPNQHDAA